MAAKPDYYRILGVDSQASEQEIRIAFRKKAFEYHPDRNRAADAGDRFKEINAAYLLLTDPVRRSQYDRSRHASGDPSATRSGSSRSGPTASEEIRRERERRERIWREYLRREAQREQAQREQAQREQAQREQAQREQAQRERAQQEQAQRERAQRKQAQQEQAQREQAQQEQPQREQPRRDTEEDMPIQDRDYYRVHRRRGGGASRRSGGSSGGSGGASRRGGASSSRGRGWCWFIAGVILTALIAGGAYYWTTLQKEGAPASPTDAAAPTVTPTQTPTLTPASSALASTPTPTQVPCADPTPTSAPVATATTTTPDATPTPEWPPAPLSDAWREWALGWSSQQVDATLAQSNIVFEEGLNDLEGLPLSVACPRVAAFKMQLEIATYLVDVHRMQLESVPDPRSAINWRIWLWVQDDLLGEAILSHAPVAECRSLLATPTPAPTLTLSASPSTPLPPCPPATPTPSPTATPTATPRPRPTATPTPRPTSTATPTATPTITRGSAQWIAALEQSVHELINQQRVSPLGFDDALAAIARSHSADMARSNYFSHTNLRGQSPSDRGAAVGYDCRKDFGSYYTYGLAENIYSGTLYSQYWTRNGVVVNKDYSELDEFAFVVVDGWMNSPGHRENILDGSYDVEGIGVAVSADERVYVTQNFC